MLAAKHDEFLAMVRALARVLRWVAGTPGADIARAVAGFFPDVPQPRLAAAIERYRALGLYAGDPILRREGFDRLQQAMLSGGALNRPVAFETCVDNALAERVVAEVACLGSNPAVPGP
jgi:NitT/TauT family transport system substrate-binding protein